MFKSSKLLIYQDQPLANSTARKWLEVRLLKPSEENDYEADYWFSGKWALEANSVLREAHEAFTIGSSGTAQRDKSWRYCAPLKTLRFVERWRMPGRRSRAATHEVQVAMVLNGAKITAGGIEPEGGTGQGVVKIGSNLFQISQPVAWRQR